MSQARQKQPRRWIPWALGGVLFAAAMLAYAPAMRAGFIWDDNIYLTANRDVTQPGRFHLIWTGPNETVGQYYPLTVSTFWLEYRLWGPRPQGYHLVNVLLHAIGAVLVWRVLRGIMSPSPLPPLPKGEGKTVLGPWLAAMLFALHPVGVATVAWVAERKNVLSLVFAMLAALAFLRFEAAAGRGRWRWYAAAIAMFLLALLSKTAVAPLPAAFLLAAWWRRGRISWRDLARVGPFLVLAAGLAAVTVYFEHGTTRGQPELAVDWPTRLAVAGRAVWFYLAAAVLPINLTVIYRRWAIDPRQVTSYLPLASLLLAAAALWWQRRRSWARAAIFGLGYFVLTLLPVLGLVSISFMSYAWVADHWQYSSLIGVCALAGAGWRAAAQLGPKARIAATVAATAVLVLLFVLTWQRAALYENTLRLWTDNIAKNPQAAIAFANRGEYFLKIEDFTSARDDLDRALALNPRNGFAWNNRGALFSHLGQLDRAVGDFSRALELNPRYAAALNNRGIVYWNLGRFDLAAADLDRAIALDPANAVYYADRGNFRAIRGASSQAIADYTTAIDLDPALALAYCGRGNVYSQLGNIEAALADVNRAIELNPRSVIAFNNRGNLAIARGDYDRAIADLTRAIELDPKLATPYLNRAMARCRNKDYDHAWADVKAAQARGGQVDPAFLAELRKASGRNE